MSAIEILEHAEHVVRESQSLIASLVPDVVIKRWFAQFRNGQIGG